MYGLGGTPEQDAFAWLANQRTRLLNLATVYQRMRNRLTAAQVAGVSVGDVRTVTEAVNSLERDYRAARAKLSWPGGNLQIANASAQGMQAVFSALFRRTELLEDSVRAIEQRMPVPPPVERAPGILESVGNITKWVVIGGALWLANKLLRS